MGTADPSASLRGNRKVTGSRDEKRRASYFFESICSKRCADLHSANVRVREPYSAAVQANGRGPSASRLQRFAQDDRRPGDDLYEALKRSSRLRSSPLFSGAWRCLRNAEGACV